MFKAIFVYADKLVQFLGSFGYFGVFIVSFLDRITIFLIPAEVVLPAYGILISQGKFSFWPVFFWVTVGSFLGNFILYLIFLKGGRVFLEKYGKYVLISKHELGHLDYWFSRYGDKIVLIGYLIPTSIRSLVPIPAGLSGMKLSKFSFYTFIGSLPFNFLYLFFGMKAGDRLDEILAYLDKFNFVVILLIVILVAWYIFRHFRNRHLTH